MEPPTYDLSQFCSVAQSYLTLCDPMDCSTPTVHHQLPEFTQSHVHRVGDASQPSHPLSSPSPPAFNLSQHRGHTTTPSLNSHPEGLKSFADLAEEAAPGRGSWTVGTSATAARRPAKGGGPRRPSSRSAPGAGTAAGELRSGPGSRGDAAGGREKKPDGSGVTPRPTPPRS